VQQLLVGKSVVVCAPTGVFSFLHVTSGALDTDLSRLRFSRQYSKVQHLLDGKSVVVCAPTGALGLFIERVCFFGGILDPGVSRQESTVQQLLDGSSVVVCAPTGVSD
jgi:superfamily II RNA helicase